MLMDWMQFKQQMQQPFLSRSCMPQNLWATTLHQLLNLTLSLTTWIKSR
ncbi:hypothetical protein LINPERPRIM_LOCUS4176 [Linum perenne]